MRPRARDHGWQVGHWPTGPGNAVTDVAGVRVGHARFRGGARDDEPGMACTGVTVLDVGGPGRWRRRWSAGSHVVNGFGQLTGRDVIEAQGALTGPIFLTGTRSLGRVYDAAIAWALADDPDAARADIPIPVVGECDDGYLSSPDAVCDFDQVAEAAAALASGPVPEGGVGAGAGMHLFGYKGGIGTASRRVRTSTALPVYTVGVLLLTNFGNPEDMRLPPGAGAAAPPGATPRPGSCIGVVVTDAPLHPGQLSRLAARAGFGLIRAGSVGRTGSGEILLAVSTATAIDPAVPLMDGRFLTDRSEGEPDTVSQLYAATAEASEEAVWNALVAGTTTVGHDGHVLPGYYP